MRHGRLLCSVLAFSLAHAHPSGAQKAPLAIEAHGAWRGLWRPDSAPPLRWVAGDSALLAALRWTVARPGLSYAEVPLRGDGEAWRTRGIVVRIDPARVRFRLDTVFGGRREPDGARIRTPRWRTDGVPASAILAVNAGQFYTTILGTLPWGWVMLDGREWRSPGVGPLSTGVVIDSAGAVTLVPPAALSSPDRTHGVQWGFQSFPTLLDGDGSVPAMLRPGSSGVDLTHRDARLAIGTMRDGTVLIAMTRFDVFGPTLGAVPFGLTTPEMAAFMGALGCNRAVMLDGGISAQLQLRDATGAWRRWPGWRRVPMGLVAFPR